MDLHRGRVIDHIHLRARDLAATQAFYAALLQALSIPVVSEEADELWIDAADTDTPPTHVHLAFQEVVFHGVAERSAESVVVSFTPPGA